MASSLNWLAFSAMLYFFCASGDVAVAQESIPLTISDQGHLLIKAKVNGVEGNFILDTGAGLTLLTKQFASRVSNLKKLDEGYTGFRATGERMDLELYEVNEITVASHRHRASKAAVIDANFGDLSGLISLMSFQDQPFTLDFENKMLILETAKSLSKRMQAGSVVLVQLDESRGKSLDVFAYFTLNGKLNLQFLLDSGAGNDVFKINARHLPMLGIDSTDNRQVTKSRKRSELNAAIQTVIYKAGIPDLRLKDQPAIRKENIKAQFVEGLIYDGVVSINWMGKEITFDLKNEVMIVSRG